jgi:hypothetical protein
MQRDSAEIFEENTPAAALRELDSWAEPCNMNQWYVENPYQLAVSLAYTGLKKVAENEKTEWKIRIIYIKNRRNTTL